MLFSKTIFLPSFYLTLTLNSLEQGKKQDKNLYMFTDPVQDVYCYKDTKGKIVIDTGKYAICFTDTFKSSAIPPNLPTSVALIFVTLTVIIIVVLKN